MDLKQAHAEYEEIMRADISQGRKDLRLANLMTRMESEFKISQLSGSNNKKAMSLYRKISQSRSL